MKKDKFDTFVILLGSAFEAMEQHAEEQHVTIVSEHGYNLAINMVVNTRYPEIVKNAPKMEFNEINFLTHLPRQFGTDLTTDQLHEFYKYLKEGDKIKSMNVFTPNDSVFLFTDKIIILIAKEPYDKSGVN